MALKYDPAAQRKKYALVKWIRAWDEKHPADRITYADGFDPETDVIGTPSRETLKKVQRIADLEHISGQFDRATMRLLFGDREPGIRKEVMAVAHSQLGVHEWPDGSNRGEVMKYLKAAGVTVGAPWCASFVTWCLKEAGLKKFPGNPAWVPAWHEFGRQHKLLVPVEKSKLGDLWIWWRDQHIGFCDDTDPGNVVALGLDGNVGAHGGSVTHVVRTSREITGVIDLVKLAALK